MHLRQWLQALGDMAQAKTVLSSTDSLLMADRDLPLR
jgi:hypothetical protein